MKDWISSIILTFLAIVFFSVLYPLIALIYFRFPPLGLRGLLLILLPNEKIIYIICYLNR